MGRGIAALALGHAPNAAVKAVQRRAEELVHVCGTGASCGPPVRLLERLCELAAGAFPKQAVRLHACAEAAGTCVKVARAYAGRQAIVVFECGYHGRTNMTLGMTSKYGLFKKGFGPFPSEVYRLPFPNMYRRPTGLSEEQ